MLKILRVVLLLMAMTAVGCAGQFRNIADSPGSVTELRVYNEAACSLPRERRAPCFWRPS
jgi:uncharacterized membrane protein YadS